MNKDNELHQIQSAANSSTTVQELMSLREKAKSLHPVTLSLQGSVIAFIDKRLNDLNQRAGRS